MSELIQKQEQFRDLTQLKESAGWKILYEQLSVRMMADQLKFVAPPSQVSAEERVYLGGRVGGLADAANLLDVLLSGLESEIELIRATEEKPNDNADSSNDDAELAGRSHSIDPGTAA